MDHAVKRGKETVYAAKYIHAAKYIQAKHQVRTKICTCETDVDDRVAFRATLSEHHPTLHSTLVENGLHLQLLLGV